MRYQTALLPDFHREDTAPGLPSSKSSAYTGAHGLEEFSKKLPAPVMAACVLFIAILGFFVVRPLHTICNTQRDALEESQRGVLFPQKVGKRTYPGKIQPAMESCRLGNSSGACYEYFNILRRVALKIKDGASECAADILDLSIDKYAKMERYESYQDGDKERQALSSVEFRAEKLSKVLEEGLEMMVVKAWGEAPPEPGPLRFGWMQESELAVFCHIQDVVRRSRSPESYQELQMAILKKLPGEKRTMPASPGYFRRPPSWPFRFFASRNSWCAGACFPRAVLNTAKASAGGFRSTARAQSGGRFGPQNSNRDRGGGGS